MTSALDDDKYDKVRSDIREEDEVVSPGVVAVIGVGIVAASALLISLALGRRY